jgi:hypothetical protein
VGQLPARLGAAHRRHQALGAQHLEDRDHRGAVAAGQRDQLGLVAGGAAAGGGDQGDEQLAGDRPLGRGQLGLEDALEVLADDGGEPAERLVVGQRQPWASAGSAS